MDNINKEIKQKVLESNWRNGGDSAGYTFTDIVLKSFEEVKKNGRHANACRFYEMYHPEIGNLRKSKSYSAFAPTNAMEYNDRKVDPDLRPFSSYKPKRGEWKSQLEKVNHTPHVKINKAPTLAALPPLPPTYRHQYPTSADLTRFENFAIYWNGRARGLELSQPFLYEPERDNYNIAEDRRYQRLYWAPKFIPHQPSARHARQIMLTAY
uniref:Uncharacterized protein n=2 Tax=Meloidogyne incognita group TaxID=654580 RepID=A0A915LUZ8_MELJA